ncbi:MAG: hypothetical protein ACM3L8_00975, partial [Verrucomicrobiota bacterium]
MSPARRAAVLRKAVVAALLLLAGWMLTKAVSAGNRHQIASPTRSAPDGGGTMEFRYPVTPQSVYALVRAGQGEGVLPDGSRVTLTVNEELQAQIFELFRRFDPPYGVFAAMEPDTGRVLALVGYRRGGESV